MSRSTALKVLLIVGVLGVLAPGILPARLPGSALVAPTHAARVHFIDVGQGEANLLEFDKSAVMIDSGGENTANPNEAGHLVDYLNKFFAGRPDLNRTIDTIIVSHPHIDHARRLNDVVTTFSVKNLIDGGEPLPPLLQPLAQARQAVTNNGGKHFVIRDQDVLTPGFSNPALRAIHDADPTVDFRVLSGSRGCQNPNNSSITVLVTINKSTFIFGGDGEDIKDNVCAAEIPTLIGRFNATHLLHADVYKANHHGSANGTDQPWMRAISPKVVVITAGKHDPAHITGDGFDAFDFGHPRESVIQIMEANMTALRNPAVTVETMDGVKLIHRNRVITKNIYCTCWDGDLVVNVGPNGALDVKGSAK
jgi:competence protein ComEC